MRYQLACFDLDGVIADSSTAIPVSINRALGDLGIPELPPAELVQFIGPPLLDTFRLVIEDAGGDVARARAGVDAYRFHYRTESLLHTTVYPGVLELLERLAGLTRLLVVTSKPAEAAIPILEHLGAARFFEGVYAPELDELEEPKTETLRRALEDSRLTGAPGVMIGDRVHDILAGKANSLATAGVLWGFGSRAELELAGADALAADAAELESILSR